MASLGALARMFSFAAPAAEPKVEEPAPRIPSRGYQDPRGSRKTRVVVNLDPVHFDRIRARAVARDVSVAAVVRELIDRGLSRTKE